jgi:hypothetical protein
MMVSLNLPPLVLVETLFGKDFDGHVVLWESATRSSQFFSSTALPQLAQEIERLKPTNDLYIGIATQEQDLGPRHRGKGDTTATVGAFFADIDFASSKDSHKAYPPDEETALKVLDGFVHRPTLVIRTGNGLHAHWAFDKPISFESTKDRKAHETNRRAFARELGQVFKAEGYEIDGVQDLARVCRLPGTFNHKSKPPKTVEAIIFNAAARIDPTLYGGAPNRRGDKSRKRRDGMLAHHLKIRLHCAWYRHTTGEGAATCAEPDWYAAASITSRTKDGEQHFHDYSRQHPGYDQREAEDKLARALAEAGPRTCEAIRDAGNDHFCDQCPHFGRVKSPIQLGRRYDPGDLGPIPVGFTQWGAFALIDQSRRIPVFLTPGQILDFKVLLGLAERDFWQGAFPDQERGFDAGTAGETLMAACREAGPFNPARVRGRGVWLEDGKVVINLGAEVPQGFKNVYLCFEPIEIPAQATFPAERLLAVLEKFSWRRPQDAVLLLGWLAIAAICGALSWRPHCFVYGPAVSGKSTIHRLASAILRPLGLSIDGQSSEAGIRQVLGCDSLPVVVDEFETDQGANRLAGVVRLARSASSAESPVLRGTQGGQAIQYSIRTAFFFSAINVTGMNPADETRILFLELRPHDGDIEAHRHIQAEHAFFEPLGPAWCGWMASNVHHVAPAIETFQTALHTVTSRHRQNMATVLSGAFIALHGRPPVAEEAADWAVKYAVTIEHHARAHERNDAQDALDHLFAHVVRDDYSGAYPLAHWLGRELEQLTGTGTANDEAALSRILATHDMRVITTGDQVGLMIRNGSAAIDRIFDGTRWQRGAWKRALGQYPGAFSPPHPIRFPNSATKSRCIGLPLEVIPPSFEMRISDEW